MKCPRCGFMQSRQTRCKRCGNPLEVETRIAAPPRSSTIPGVDNPYAPPVASYPGAAISTGAGGGVARDGAIIVARDGAPFPDRCVHCNQSAQGFRVKKTFYWHAPNWYLLVLLSILIYAVVAMVVRKKASFELALCPLHRSRRRLLMGISLGLPLAALVIVLVSGGEPASVWGLGFATVAGAIFGSIGVRILSPKKIEDGYAFLKGADASFLASLPPIG
jgi:hypothetical protein